MSGEPEFLPREQPAVSSGPADLTAYCLMLQGLVGLLLRERCPEGLVCTTAQLDSYRRNEGPAFDSHPCDGGITVFRAIKPLGAQLREGGLPVPEAPDAL